MENKKNNNWSEIISGFEPKQFVYVANAFAGGPLEDFIAEEVRLREEARLVDAENARRLTRICEKIDETDMREYLKSLLKEHARVIFTTHYASAYLSDADMIGDIVGEEVTE